MAASSLSASSIQALTGTTVASTASGLLAWTWPFHAVGMAPAVLFMALAGTAAGLISQPPNCARRRLFGLAFAYTVVAAAAAVVLPEFALLAWLKPVAPATALLIAYFAQTLLPALGGALAERVKRSIGGGK
jgi:hypothetical protein